MKAYVELGWVGEDAYLSTDHAASSYGQPVLIIGQSVFGPADLPVETLAASPAELAVPEDIWPDPANQALRTEAGRISDAWNETVRPYRNAASTDQLYAYMDMIREACNRQDR